MTWDEIVALDVHKLDLAIEEHCYHEEWAGRNTTHYYTYLRTFPGDVAQPRCHSHSWETCMPLAWRYGITPLIDCGVPDGTMERRTVWWDWNAPHHGIIVTTEAEARQAICRLALWRARQDNPFA